MNNYSFPEHIPLSDTSKNLISKILNLEPTKRPNLDEIYAHSFLANEESIPKFLPVSVLTIPPTSTWLK